MTKNQGIQIKILLNGINVNDINPLTLLGEGVSVFIYPYLSLGPCTWRGQMVQV